MREPKARRIVLLVMSAGYFLVLLDVTIVNVSLPKIATGLGAGVSDLQWVVDGYAVALATLMLTGGTLGDLRGHKRIVMGGLGLFGAASLGCALAPATVALVGFRVLQGAGAALMLPGTLAVVTHAYPEGAEQARAIGTWAGIGSAALPAGPLLGGALTQAFGWRAVFLVNLPIVAVALVLAARVVRESADPGQQRLDLPGVALGGGLLATLTFAFIEAGRRGGAGLVAGAAGAVLLLAVAFVVVERAAERPVLPLALLRRPAFSIANSAAGAMNLGTLGLLFVLTLYLQDVRHYSTLRAGLALFPLFAPLSVLAPLAGRATSRLGPRWPMRAGLLTAAAGVGLLCFVGRETPYPGLATALVVWGVGLGVLTPAVVAAAIAAVPAERAGLASAVNNTARQAGGAIGIAALGALAGAPAGRSFLGGFHVAAAIVAALFVAAAAATLAMEGGRNE